jgi:hypothetical protein
MIDINFQNPASCFWMNPQLPFRHGTSRKYLQISMHFEAKESRFWLWNRMRDFLLPDQTVGTFLLVDK